MSSIDKFRFLTVRVNGGSGCIVQCTQREYTYIFTARHVIKDLEIGDLKIRQEREHESSHDGYQELVPLKRVYHHPNMDASIILVKKVNDIRNVELLDQPFNSIENYYVCGHPNTKRHNEDSYRQNKLDLSTRTVEGYIEAQSDPVIVHSEVIGQSGGGVLKIEEDKFTLAGIFKGTVDDDADIGRVEFTPAACFEEIIDSNREDLSPLGSVIAAAPVLTVEELLLIKKLISYARLGDALRDLEKYNNSNNLEYNTAITLQQSRLHQVERDNILGTISQSDYKQTIAQISLATMNIIGLIERDLDLFGE